MAALLIAINYYQTVSALSQYYDLPISINEIIAVVKIFTSVTGAGLGIECLSASLQEYQNKYLAIMLEPPFCVAVILLVYLIGKLYIIIARTVPVLLNEWGVTCIKMGLFVINLLFFPITSVAIDAFRCTKDPVTKISYISQYPYERCDSISLGGRVMALLIYTLGIIAFFSYLIYKYKRTKNIEQSGAALIVQTFGFFFLHFRERYLYFSIVVLLRRFLISLTTSLIPVNSALALALNTVILLLYAQATLVLRPFRTHRDNLLEITTTLCCVFVYVAVVGMSVSGFGYGDVVVEVLYFIVNIFVILWCLGEFGRNYISVFVAYWRHRNQIGTLDNIGT